MEISKEVLEKANEWLQGDFDEATKAGVKALMENDPKELTESFYRTLEFGTGGLRGIMGVGTNRMNVYTVGMATQGLANYLKKEFAGETIKVAIAYDNRNNNILFSNTVANIFAANDIVAYVFDDLRPTPELSFAIRELGCQSGVMITASHNPKEYSGYKAYWNDGAQVVAPHDKNIIDEVNKISSIDQVKWNGKPENIVTISPQMDDIYINRVVKLSLSPEAVKRHADLKIVYTPIHGTGRVIMPKALHAYGFRNVLEVEAQCVPDGNFPTVVHPNPEDPAAMTLAVELAEKEGADLILATDPDADRIAIGIRNDEGKILLLNGNQTAAILTYYLLRRNKELGRLDGREFIVKTIVTTELLAAVARSFGVEYYNVLTGFKFIAGVIRENEGKKRYIGGGEESYGYLIGDFVRDKDSISAGCMFAEIMAWAKENGKTVYDVLMDIYKEYGFFYEGLLSMTKYGMEGAAEIRAMMEGYRTDPPKEINGSAVTAVYDYKLRKTTDLRTGKVTPIDLPVSDVLQFTTEDGTIVSVRPSGTEPKIKFYFGVRETMRDAGQFDAVKAAANAKIEAIKRSMGLV